MVTEEEEEEEEEAEEKEKKEKMKKWAPSWQNQQNGLCAQRRLDQPGHPSSLIRVFAVSMKKA